MYDLENRINFSVFPGFQGGPHNHTIAALATALKQAMTPEYKAYQMQVLRNCKALANALMSKGYKLVSDGTDNHLVLVDLKTSRGLDGARVERVLEVANIATNKNTVPGDKSALIPGGIRLGTPALTSRYTRNMHLCFDNFCRGLTEDDFVKVAEFFDRACVIATDIKGKTGSKLKDFKAVLANGSNGNKDLEDLCSDVTAFSRSFPTVGF